jgi:DNA-binding CsgD family transcriptional regulator
MAQEVWGVLRGLGLGRDAEAVYRRLLGAPDSTAQDVARELELSEHRLRAALAQLSAMELVDRWPGGSEKLHVASPAVALAGLLAEQQVDLARRGRQVEWMRAQISALAQEWQVSRRSQAGDVEWLDGVEAVRERLAQLTPTARAECLSLHPIDPVISEAAFTKARVLNSDVLGRGLSMRTVRQDGSRLHAPTLRHMTGLAEQGAQLRVAPLLSTRMIIYDRRTAIVELDPEDRDRGAVQLTAPGIVTALHGLFERVWAGANAFGAPSPGRDERGVSPNERELLRLMFDGHTDESAARKLGVSLRTVRRMMANLAGRLGARSRFQVGALAQAKGWLDL